MSRMVEARRVGILTCHTISPAGLKYIEEWDPDLHYDIMQVLKKQKRRKKRK